MLEARTVLSVVPLTVSSLADSGPGTLRAAIETADADPSGDDTIDFTVTGTIELESALPALRGRIDIEGPGSSALTVERDPAATSFGLFSVASGADVTLSGLTLSGGNATFGGGVWEDGATLAIDGCVVQNCSATYGGAVAGHGGSVTITGSTLSGNAATGSSGSGGAINGDGTDLVLDQDTLTANTAATGGGIAALNGSLSITASHIDGNSASSSGGGVYASHAVVTMQDDVISGNQATLAFGFGGGLALSGGSALLDGLEVSGNSAGNGGGINGSFLSLELSTSTVTQNTSTGLHGQGGGINLTQATATISETEVSGNRAAGGGGIASNTGTITLIQDTVSNNTATGWFGTGGGGLSLLSGSATVSLSTFDGNAGLSGGAIASQYATLTLDQDSLTDNTATGSGGGAIDNGGMLIGTALTVDGNQSQGGQGGGGILNRALGTLSLSDTRVSSNQAIAAAATDVFGGGLLNLGSATIDGGQFVGNRAEGGAGLDFFSGSAGGAIDNFGGASLTATGTTFRDNQAIGAADDANGSYYGMGGAIENNAGFNVDQPSTAHLEDCLFVANQAVGNGGASNGGAIDNQGSGTVMTLDGCTLFGNQAVCAPTGQSNQSLGGGIINVFDSTMTITSCTIAGNIAQGGDGTTPSPNVPATGIGSGGGILNSSATMTISDSTIMGNLAAGGATLVGPGGNALGGGIDNSSLVPGLPGTLTMTRTRVIGNMAVAASGGSTPSADGVLLGVAAGGGLNVWADSSATVTGCLFVGNIARGGSGGAGLDGGAAIGGGIAVGTNAYFPFPDSSTLNLSNSQVIGNQAIGGTGGSGASGGAALGGGVAVLGSQTGPDGSPTGGSSAVFQQVTIAANAALGGPGPVAPGDGLGGGLDSAVGGTVTADHKTHVLANHASTAGNNIDDESGGGSTTT